MIKTLLPAQRNFSSISSWITLFRASGSTVFLMFVFYSVSWAQPGATIFRDDFTGPNFSGWQVGPAWSLDSGWACNYIDGTGGTLRSSTYYTESSYIIETTAKGFTNNYYREFRITFGQQSLGLDSMYVLSYTPYFGGQLTLGKANTNVYYPRVLDEAILYPQLEQARWYKFKIAKYRSGLIQVYLDRGNGYSTFPIVEAIDNSYSRLGHFGWQVDTQTFSESFCVDYIEAKVPTVEKPAVREKPPTDNLISQVSALNNKPYSVAKLNVGVKHFIDRTYTITSVPSYLQNASFIQAANDDKFNTSNTFLTAFIKEPAVAFIAYDPRATQLPAWLRSWEKVNDRIGIVDPATDHFDLYRKVLSPSETYPNPLIIGGNMAIPAAGAQLNYLLILIPQPSAAKYEAENAQLLGAVAAKNQPGYSGEGFVDYINPSNDYIEWTIQNKLAAQYTLGFVFANGGSAARSLQISVNGVSQGIYAFGSTASWQSWAFLNGPQVALPVGVSKIRATAIGSSGPNIDFLSVIFSEQQALSRAKKSSEETFILDVSHPEFGAFPNPTSSHTTIFYIVEKKSQVQLTVYDSWGRKVKEIASLEEPGRKEVILNTQELNGGWNYYKIRTGKKNFSGKVYVER